MNTGFGVIPIFALQMPGWKQLSVCFQRTFRYFVVALLLDVYTAIPTIHHQ
jgi:hypothetical protein